MLSLLRATRNGTEPLTEEVFSAVMLPAGMFLWFYSGMYCDNGLPLLGSVHCHHCFDCRSYWHHREANYRQTFASEHWLVVLGLFRPAASWNLNSTEEFCNWTQFLCCKRKYDRHGKLNFKYMYSVYPVRVTVSDRLHCIQRNLENAFQHYKGKEKILLFWKLMEINDRKTRDVRNATGNVRKWR